MSLFPLLTGLHRPIPIEGSQASNMPANAALEFLAKYDTSRCQKSSLILYFFFSPPHVSPSLGEPSKSAHHSFVLASHGSSFQPHDPSSWNVIVFPGKSSV